jgi:hypothetical protein
MRPASTLTIRRIVCSRASLLTALLGAMLALAGAPAAGAEEVSPWWGLTSSARPTNLHSGPAKDEVQELNVNATGGQFALVEAHEGNPNFEHFTILPFDATAAQVQEHLEAEVYPSRKVTVTGGYAEGTGSYVITFPGQSVEPMLVLAQLTGGSPESEAKLTELARGAEDGKIVVTAENLGYSQVNGASVPVTVTDRLPPGISATAIEGVAYKPTQEPLKCSIASLSCDFVGTLEPYESLDVIVSVKVQDAHSGEQNEASILGGGALGTSIRRPLRISGEPTPFGVEDFGLALEEEGGSPDTQAGSHPFQVTSTLALNQTADPRRPPAPVRDLHVELPPGLVGNATATPRCTELQFDTPKPTGHTDQCPPNTAIGAASLTLTLTGLEEAPIPVFNLVPGPGEPARFGFLAEGSPVIFDTSVRAGGDYGVTVSSNNISQLVGLLSARVTLWGVPGDPRHDASRGWDCIGGGRDRAAGEPPCTPLGSVNPPAFLTLPTSCTGPLKTSVEGDSWAAPGLASRVAPPVSYAFPQDNVGDAFGLDGCNRLSFNPSIEVTPEAAAASTPTGLNVDMKVPQEGTLAATGLAESAVKAVTVTLPEGMQVNPSSADGLEACSEGDPGGVGFTGFKEFEAGPPVATFTGTLPEGWDSGNKFCPNGSKVGVVEEIKTPLLPNPLKGAVYLAMQNANPFGSLIALYLVAEDPESGVRVKLAGNVSLNQQTGQLTSTFENTPQLPFEDLKLHFFGGSRAALSTPAHCGTYTTNAAFTPWSGNAPVSSPSSFPITSGPSGPACPNPLPFAPSLSAGSTNLQAGAFTPFTSTFSREDGNQNLAGITLHTPPGLLGKLASVTPCPEPQAAQGTCGSESLIGHTTASVGLGPNPYTVSGGRVFITQSYKGAPYGLSVAEPAKAGPFDLGGGPCDCVVVRAKIEVDRHTSALTVVSDPLPTMLQGVPLQVKHVNVTVDRPGFAFNPTNCSQMAITGTLMSEQGATARASVPFEVANCARLPFKPKFTVSTAGKTSKARGASLHVRVASGPGQANIGKVKVELPKQLPSRLTTLQKACVAKVFEANPASCPAGSVVGEGTAVTPVLRNALRGPAILVSHGGAAFPDLEIVLQGEGIDLVLVGNTNIKKGITSSTFKSVPDAPVSTFDLVLPQGPHSVLSPNLPARAHYSLCGQKLAMPTAITGQNGAVIKQTTKIAVSGCRKAKRRHRLRVSRSRSGRSHHRR